MSATNRGSERHERDFYETPAWCVDALFEGIGTGDGKTDATEYAWFCWGFGGGNWVVV